MSAIRVGTIVTHKAWGVGKVLFLTETKAVVGFAACRTPTDPGLRDVSLRGTFIEPTSSEPDPAPDNWNITLDANGRAAGPRARSARAAALKPMAAGAAISVEQAIARFKERYPTGFEDERYVTLERGWKWEKHVEWHERVGTRSLAEMAQTNLRQLAHDTQRVVQTRRKSLLDKAELTAFTVGLAADAPSRAYFAAVEHVLSSGDDDAAAFTELSRRDRRRAGRRRSRAVALMARRDGRSSAGSPRSIHLREARRHSEGYRSPRPALGLQGRPKRARATPRSWSTVACCWKRSVRTARRTSSTSSRFSPSSANRYLAPGLHGAPGRVYAPSSSAAAFRPRSERCAVFSVESSDHREDQRMIQLDAARPVHFCDGLTPARLPARRRARPAGACRCPTSSR